MSKPHLHVIIITCEPHTLRLEWCRLVTLSCKFDSFNIMCRMWKWHWHHNSTMSLVHAYQTVWTCTRWHMAWCHKKYINGERPWEGIKCAEDNQRATTWQGRKHWKDMLTWQSTNMHHKLPTTIVLSLTLSNFYHLANTATTDTSFSLWWLQACRLLTLTAMPCIHLVMYLLKQIFIVSTYMHKLITRK